MYINNYYFYDQNTIYDELDNNHITWGIYHHGMPHTLLVARLWARPGQFHRVDNFFKDPTRPEEEFPQYVFIEPSYGRTDENDQHPPTDNRKRTDRSPQTYH